MTAKGESKTARGAAACIALAVPLLVSGRATMAVAASLGVLLVLADPNRRVRFKTLLDCVRGRFGLAVCLMLAAWLPSVAFSLEPGRSLPVWLRMAGIFVGAIWVWDLLRHDPRLIALSQKVLVCGAMFAGLVGAIGLLAWPQLIALIHADGFTDIDAGRRLKSYASVVGCLLPIVLWSGLSLGRWWKWLALAYPLLAGVILFETESDAGLLAVLAAAAAATSWWCWRNRRFALLYLSAAILVCVAYTFLTSHPVIPPDQFTEPLPDLGLPAWLIDVHRQVMWRFSASVALDAPWFGHGINVSNLVAGADTPIPGIPKSLISAHPHNWILEVLIDTGFVGLMAMSAALALLLAATARLPSWTAAAALALFAAFWVSSLVNFSIWSAWWQCTFVILLAIVFATGDAEKSSSPPLSAIN